MYISFTHSIFSPQCKYLQFYFSSVRHVSVPNGHHQVFCLLQNCRTIYNIHLFIYVQMWCFLFNLLDAHSMFICIDWLHSLSNSNVHTQELTTTSYAGAGSNMRTGTNGNTKKGLTNRSNTRTPSRNIELYHLDKRTTPQTEVQQLHNFKEFQIKIRKWVTLINANKYWVYIK
jgi:hypothetical protein